MSATYKKGFHPFRWLLALLGWSFGCRWNEDDHYWRWGFRRIDGDLYDGRYDMGPAKEGKQRLIHITSESYWFGKACRRLCLEWFIRDDKRSLGLHVGIPFFFMHYIKFYWHRECWFAKKLRGQYPNALQYGLQINSSALSWNWAQDSMAWSADGSTGYQYYHNWDRYREKPRRETLHEYTEEEVRFTQPAFGSRPATEHVMSVKYEHQSLKYRRPWNKNVHHYWADIQFSNPNKPPAFSGKGENSWDCGDDGIWGCTIAIPADLGNSLHRHCTETNRFVAASAPPGQASKFREDSIGYLKKKIIDAAIKGYIQKVETNRQRQG